MTELSVFLPQTLLQNKYYFGYMSKIQRKTVVAAILYAAILGTNHLTATMGLSHSPCDPDLFLIVIGQLAFEGKHFALKHHN